MTALHCPTCDGQDATCTRCTPCGEQHPTDDELALAHVRAQLAQVTAERDRLRAALEAVVAEFDDENNIRHGFGGSLSTGGKAERIAREALRGGGE